MLTKGDPNRFETMSCDMKSQAVKTRIPDAGTNFKEYCEICGRKFHLMSMLMLHKLEKHNIKERFARISTLVTSYETEDLVYSSDSDCEYSIVTTITRIPKHGGTNGARISKDFHCGNDEAQQENDEEINFTDESGLEYANGDEEEAEMIEEHLVEDEEENVDDSPGQESTKGTARPSPRKAFQCDQCGRVFFGKISLRNHIAIIHNKEFNYLCNLCGKHFTRELGLELHMRRHNDDVRHICEICDKGFLTRQTLKEHMVVHTREKPFPCPYEGCGKTFSFGAGRRNHVKYMHKPKPFTCHYCSKSFVFKRVLEGHLRTHTGEKPCICSICGEGFGSDSILYKHKKRKHPCPMNLAPKSLPEEREHLTTL